MNDKLHEIWRRPKGQWRATWEKIPNLAPALRSECFKIVQEQMWIVSEVEYEYAIVPVGTMPTTEKIGQKHEPFSQTYKTRRMKPE